MADDQDPKPKKKPDEDEGDGADDLFDDSDVSGDEDSENGGGSDPVADANQAGVDAMAGNSGADAAKIAEVSKELAGLGIVIDPSKTAEDFLDHLCSAIKTHKATKALNEPEPEPDETPTPGAEDMATDPNNPQAKGAPEPQFVAMSNRVKSLERDSARYLAIAANARLAEVNRDIDLIQLGEQISKETAAEWKSKLGTKKLSVARGDDPEISKILLKIETLKDACLVNPLLAERVAMSKNGAVVPRSREWDDPKHKVMSDKDAEECADLLVGKRK